MQKVMCFIGNLAKVQKACETVHINAIKKLCLDEKGRIIEPDVNEQDRVLFDPKDRARLKMTKITGKKGRKPKDGKNGRKRNMSAGYTLCWANPTPRADSPNSYWAQSPEDPDLLADIDAEISPYNHDWVPPESVEI